MAGNQYVTCKFESQYSSSLKKVWNSDYQLVEILYVVIGKYILL